MKEYMIVSSKVEMTIDEFKTMSDFMDAQDLKSDYVITSIEYNAISGIAEIKERYTKSK